MTQSVSFEKHLITPCGIVGLALHTLEIKTDDPVAGSFLQTKLFQSKNALSRNAANCKRQHQNSVMIVKNINVKGSKTLIRGIAQNIGPVS
jgi:hypothetical protein